MRLFEFDTNTTIELENNSDFVRNEECITRFTVEESFPRMIKEGYPVYFGVASKEGQNSLHAWVTIEEAETIVAALMKAIHDAS